MKPELNEQELSVLRTNPLFRGLDRERLERLLADGARRKQKIDG